MMDWRPEPFEREPASEWLRSGEHPSDPLPDPDPDETPTQPAVVLVVCAFAGCKQLVWRPRTSESPCCRAHRVLLDTLRDVVRAGGVSDWQTIDHRTGLAMHRVRGVAVPALVRFKQIVVHHCYELRWMPWRDDFSAGGDAA